MLYNVEYKFDKSNHTAGEEEIALTNHYQKYIPVLLKLTILVGILFGIKYFGATIFAAVLPFLFGWGIALLLEPLIKLFKKKLKAPHGLSVLLSVLLFVIVVTIIMVTIGGVIFVQLMNIYLKIPEYSNFMIEKSQFIVEKVQDFYIMIPEDIAVTMKDGINSVIKVASSSIMLVLGALLNIITVVPEFFVFIIVTIISAYFMARDKEKIVTFIKHQFPSSWLEKYQIVRHDLNHALIGYVRAQIILMFFTFVIGLIGLFIIGIDFAFLLALSSSLLDALPILGTGTVYVPMIIWQVVKGNPITALYIGIVYGVVITVRQLMEPKVLSTQIGIHPLTTLISMYVGFRLVGVIGLIMGPIILIMIPTLQKIDMLPNWKE